MSSKINAAAGRKQRNCNLNRLIRILAATLALVLAFITPVLAKVPQSGVFDYFVLSLSWSPSFCGTQAGERDVTQCAPGRNFAFVVHGLWPQFQKGWPQNCPTEEGWVTQDNIEAMMPVMPSKKLIIHQWKKHGSCAGVSQGDYFKATRLLFEKVKIPARYLSPTADVITTPEQLVTDFVKTNLRLSADMISVQCGNAQDQARLSELRICLDKRGSFAACGANESRSCRAKSLVMPRVR
jgi:ribonuclease T2